MLEEGCQERKESKIELALLDLDTGMGRYGFVYF